MSPTQTSTITCAVAITAFVLIVAFNLGRYDGGAKTIKLRGNCGIEKIEHLKSGFYAERTR